MFRTSVCLTVDQLYLQLVQVDIVYPYSFDHIHASIYRPCFTKEILYSFTFFSTNGTLRFPKRYFASRYFPLLNLCIMVLHNIFGCADKTTLTTKTYSRFYAEKTKYIKDKQLLTLYENKKNIYILK